MASSVADRCVESFAVAVDDFLAFKAMLLIAGCDLKIFAFGGVGSGF